MLLLRLTFSSLFIVGLGAQQIPLGFVGNIYPKPCTAHTCAAITITGDPYSTTGHFSGYADPSFRQDPQTGTYWFAYSYPITQTTGSQTLSIHLASSVDGVNFTYKSVLYNSTTVTDPVSGGTDWINHEVINLFPFVVSGQTYWFAIHSVYYITNASGYNVVAGSQRFLVALTVDTDGTHGPSGLVSPIATSYLGTPATNVCTGCTTGASGSWPYDVNMSTLASELSVCNDYKEPWLNYQSGVMTLGLNCETSGGVLRNYAIFTTPNPQANSAPWAWTYVSGVTTSPFASLTDAAAICRYMMGTAWCNSNPATVITQMDVAQNFSQAVFTLAFINSGVKVGNGCVEANLVSSSPLTFTYGSPNVPQTRGFTISPDSVTQGPGSCTLGSTGIIQAHKETNCIANAPGCSTQGGEFTYLMATYMLPGFTHVTNMSWIGSTTSTVTYYNIYRIKSASETAPATPYIQIASGITTCTNLVSGICGYNDFQVVPGLQYWYYATAFSPSAGESAPSNIQAATIPSP